MNKKNDKLGKFYGIGLGPGEPELITLKGYKTLKNVDFIFAVGSRQSSNSVSKYIIEALEDVNAPITELEFVMVDNWEQRNARHIEHANTILKKIRDGQNCAFVTIGDPMTYSCCSYLLKAMLKILPTFEYEIIPGVNSWSVLAASNATPLVEDREILQIIPSFKIEDDSKKPRTKIFLKTYHSRNECLATLAPECEVLYGEKLGLEDQFISTSRDEITPRPDCYLSLLGVKKQYD